MDVPNLLSASAFEPPPVFEFTNWCVSSKGERSSLLLLRTHKFN